MPDAITPYILKPRYLFRKTLALKILEPHWSEIKSFLEVGGGNGDFTLSLLKHIPRGTVIDFSPTSITTMKNVLGSQNIDIIQGDFTDYTFQQKYSLIVMFEVLEHIRDDTAALQKIHGILQNDAYCILSVPARMRYWSIVDEVAGHYRRYEFGQLKKLFESQGFSVLSLISYGFPIINMTSYIRDIFIKANISKLKFLDVKEEQSKQSGFISLETFQFRSITGFLVRLFFNPRLLRFYVMILSIFVPLNLGDGYLCLVKKK